LEQWTVLQDQCFLALEQGGSSALSKVAYQSVLHNFSAQLIVPSRSRSHCWNSRQIHFLDRLLNCVKLGGAEARIPDTNRRNSGLQWRKFGTANDGDDDEFLCAAVLQDRGMITDP
jgi:hypothetical protein